MIKRKLLYKFQKNGQVYTDPYLGVGWTDEELAEILERRENHYISQASNEREWRNSELRDTDWMLLVDATHEGELISVQSKYLEILEYRQALRAYNLTTDARPTRPSWFTD